MDTASAIKALKRYRDNRQELGHFLSAMLENDLANTMRHADRSSWANLKDIFAWLWMDMPGDAWGSPEAVRAWLHPEQKPTMDQYLARIDGLLCPQCRNVLPTTISSYEHQWGWPLAGCEARQWLYITCPNCGVDHALWKLGVPRPDHQPGSKP